MFATRTPGGVNRNPGCQVAAGRGTAAGPSARPAKSFPASRAGKGLITPRPADRAPGRAAGGRGEGHVRPGARGGVPLLSDVSSTK